MSKAATTDQIIELLSDDWVLVKVRGYYHLIRGAESIYANANSVKCVLRLNPDRWQIDCWTNGPAFEAKSEES
jgi:hypothetical protein